jgi:hypothetical protein
VSGTTQGKHRTVVGKRTLAVLQLGAETASPASAPSRGYLSASAGRTFALAALSLAGPLPPLSPALPSP